MKGKVNEEQFWQQITIEIKNTLNSPPAIPCLRTGGVDKIALRAKPSEILPKKQFP